MTRKPINLIFVSSMLAYDPDTGVIMWKKKPARNFFAGDVAGYLSRSDGYIYICIKYEKHAAHRLAWALHYGQDPSNSEVDHINGIKSDNRISNLRLATKFQNMANYPTPRNNTSGVKGVCWDRTHKSWVARIRIDGTRKFLGTFSNIDEAAAAYATASLRYHKEFSKIS